MGKKELRELAERMLYVYSGILYQNREFEPGNTATPVYEFDCPQFEELRSKYQLAEIAGKGSDFARAKRLLHYLASGLSHSPWYDNHVACNALELLEYSFGNPEQGINCLNKAKILVECCLALGIYGRRVRILPFSPYDFDNHVVAEIYDRELEKWIMLDPTTDGYFIDESRRPLSLLEIRDKFAKAEFVTFVHATEGAKDVEKLRRKHLGENMYLCKNLFYFQVEQYATFGERGSYLHLIPRHYSVKETRRANLEYRIQNLPETHDDLRKKFREALEKLEQEQEAEPADIQVMLRKPC